MSLASNSPRESIFQEPSLLITWRNPISGAGMCQDSFDKTFFLLLLHGQRNGEIQFLEPECVKILMLQTINIHVSIIQNNLVGNRDFDLEYGYLVITVGAQVNTFNTPGVYENCHFFKEVEDAQRIRRTVMTDQYRMVLSETLGIISNMTHLYTSDEIDQAILKLKDMFISVPTVSDTQLCQCKP